MSLGFLKPVLAAKGRFVATTRRSKRFGLFNVVIELSAILRAGMTILPAGHRQNRDQNWRYTLIADRMELFAAIGHAFGRCVDGASSWSFGFWRFAVGTHGVGKFSSRHQDGCRMVSEKRTRLCHRNFQCWFERRRDPRASGRSAGAYRGLMVGNWQFVLTGAFRIDLWLICWFWLYKRPAKLHPRKTFQGGIRLHP